MAYFLKSSLFWKCVCLFNLICKEGSGAGLMLFFLILSALPATFFSSLKLWPADTASVSSACVLTCGLFLGAQEQCPLEPSIGGRDDSQMVLLGGSIFYECAPPNVIVHTPTGEIAPITEDVCIMDTKLKIIEILHR